MRVRKKIDDRLEAVPKELRDPPVAFAAASFLGPLFIVLLALAAGQNDVSSPLYSVAAIVCVAGLVGFFVTSLARLRTRRAENDWIEEQQALRRHARRPSMSRPRSDDEERVDARQAS
jgi:hypothetical protein